VITCLGRWKFIKRNKRKAKRPYAITFGDSITQFGYDPTHLGWVSPHKSGEGVRCMGLTRVHR
jgi:hypothetical protein